MIDLRESLVAIRNDLRNMADKEQVVVLSTEIVKDILQKKKDWKGDSLALEEMCSNISSCCTQCSQLIIDTRKRVNEILQFLDGQDPSQKLQ